MIPSIEGYGISSKAGVPKLTEEDWVVLFPLTIFN